MVFYAFYALTRGLLLSRLRSEKQFIMRKREILISFIHSFYSFFISIDELMPGVFHSIFINFHLFNMKLRHCLFSDTESEIYMAQ